MFRKTKLGAGLLSLLSIFTAGTQVHAALEQNVDQRANTEPERFDLPLLFDASAQSSIKMTPRLQEAIQKAMQNADNRKLKDGIFIVDENGEIKYLGSKADLDNLRKEVLRLKREKHAGPKWDGGNCG